MIDVVQGVAALGPEWDGLFAAGPGVQSRRWWFEASAAAAVPAGAVPQVLCVRDAGRPAALLPIWAGPAPGAMTSPYTVQFQPLVAGDTEAAGRVFGTYLRRWPVSVLDAIDADWPGLPAFTAGLRAAGLAVARFDHFGNWFEPVRELDWPGYLARRPGVLRETIRRRGKAAAKEGAIRFEVVRAAAGLTAGLAAYEAVYARSWKVPEPFPLFNDALLSRAAEAGVLRLGVMWQGDVPLAAQYWTVEDGIATVHKLAHDEAARALSPGTVLTAHMIRMLIEEGGLTELDFGRGDTPYKRQWTASRRQRIGLLLANPWRPAGLAALARHQAGVLRRRFRPVVAPE